MSVLSVVRAWWELAYLDYVRLRGFRALHQAVKRTQTRPVAVSPETIDKVVQAVERASVLYPRPAWCLHRSAAVTRLLRRRGITASMVLGFQLAPVRSHAWVEANGRVVSDGRDDLEHYFVLDRW